jgi:hypothetical protein
MFFCVLTVILVKLHILLSWLICFGFIGLGLWWLAPLSTIFQLYCGGQFFLWGELGDPEKNTHPPQITDKLFQHNVLLEITVLYLKISRYQLDI